MSCYLTARDMDDEGLPHEIKLIVAIGRNNVKIVLRPTEPMPTPLVCNNN